MASDPYDDLVSDRVNEMLLPLDTLRREDLVHWIVRAVNLADSAVLPDYDDLGLDATETRNALESMLGIERVTCPVCKLWTFVPGVTTCVACEEDEEEPSAAEGTSP